MSDTFEFSLFGKKRNQKKQTPKAATESTIFDSPMPGKSEAELPAPSGTSPSEMQQSTATPGAIPALPAPLMSAFTQPPPTPNCEELEALFPSQLQMDRGSAIPNAKNLHELDQEKIVAPQTKLLSAPTGVVPVANAMPRREERRRKRRVQISAPVRVRAIHLTQDCPDETTTTINISRNGLLFHTQNSAFERNMDLAVTLPYSAVPGLVQAEQPGRVVWVTQNPDGTNCVAVALGSCPNAEIVRGYGDTPVVEDQTEAPAEAQAELHIDRHVDAQSAYMITFDRRDPSTRRPLVLLLDADANLRESVKGYLNNEGYEVVTVSNAGEARKVLNQCTPSLVVAEIEGEGMPGYDVCTHCKGTPRLQSVPVMLMTSSAYPSDYASAHSLGAVVCMAKPFKQERLGHVVRLLAPPLNANDNATPPRPADPTRRACRPAATPKAVASTLRRFKFFKP